MKKVGIMQPYFMPYIGYFKLINFCDEFVVYDNIKYTKKGWINRNNLLINNESKLFSIPLLKDSDFLNISQREVSSTFEPEKLLNLVSSSYSKSPEFSNVYTLLKNCLFYESNNLFDFIFYSINEICNYLNIKTKLHISSNIDIDHNLKSADKVLSLCKKLNATSYINPIGGLELYDKEYFKKEGVELFFLENVETEYQQFSKNYVSSLSIIDAMMHLTKKDLMHRIEEDYLIK